jgi:hypothetical protein
VDNPSLHLAAQFEPVDFQGVKRYWRAYICARCAGLVTAVAPGWDHEVQSLYPSTRDVSEDIPERPRTYLHQAINSLSSPAGAVMLAASAVDSMLKAKGLSTGSLYSRIDEAAKQHLITGEMAQWAHEVRLDANDQRHADDQAPLPTQDQAQKCVDFATALGQFLFVLPARIHRGIASAHGK